MPKPPHTALRSHPAHAETSLHTWSRRHLLLAGLTGLALAVGCSKRTVPKGKTLTPGATVLCIGDSLTFGYGANASASYPEQLAQRIPHPVKNAGLNGDTAEGALARLPDLMQQNSPGLVLVSIGGNDFLRNLPLERTRAALLQIIAVASASAAVVVLAQPRPALLSAALGKLQDHPIYAEVASQANVPLFAGGWSEVLSQPALRSDQIHANADGYRLFAERLAAWLRNEQWVA